MPDGNGKGYVELPYTLPQDSTLFLHLREPTEAIWRRKLDWLAEKGGMVLVNVPIQIICACLMNLPPTSPSQSNSTRGSLNISAKAIMALTGTVCPKKWHRTSRH